MKPVDIGASSSGVDLINRLEVFEGLTPEVKTLITKEIEERGSGNDFDLNVTVHDDPKSFSLSVTLRPHVTAEMAAKTMAENIAREKALADGTLVIEDDKAVKKF